MFTTSRYATVATRRLAKSMAADAGQVYIARGKKTIDELALEARRLGDGTLAVVEEHKGAASVIARISIGPDGSWAWSGELKVAK